VHGRATRKAEFLARMDRLVPWAEFCALIEPHYPRAGNGRPPVGVERMLRMYLLANWFNLSDEACEDALYDMPTFRDFCRIDLGRERVPDATTLLRFRHLLEEQQIGAALFSRVGELLLAQGMKLSGGTIVDVQNAVAGMYESIWKNESSDQPPSPLLLQSPDRPLRLNSPAWSSVARAHKRESERTRMKYTESSDAETLRVSAPSASNRTLLKSVWVAPVVIALTLPRSGYGANISGSSAQPNESGDAKPKSNNGNHFGQLKRTVN